MLKILHRIVCMTGKYSSRIRASYLTSFIKGIMMKAPLIFSFFAISLFMKGQMNEKICLYLGIGLVICIAVEAVFEHITNARFYVQTWYLLKSAVWVFCRNL